MVSRIIRAILLNIFSFCHLWVKIQWLWAAWGEMFQKGIRPDSNGFVTIRSPLQIVKNPADFADFEMTENVIQNAFVTC